MFSIIKQMINFRLQLFGTSILIREINSKILSLFVKIKIFSTSTSREEREWKSFTLKGNVSVFNRSKIGWISVNNFIFILLSKFWTEKIWSKIKQMLTVYISTWYNIVTLLKIIHLSHFSKGWNFVYMKGFGLLYSD